jgi:hypothetical protein
MPQASNIPNIVKSQTAKPKLGLTPSTYASVNRFAPTLTSYFHNKKRDMHTIGNEFPQCKIPHIDSAKLMQHAKSNKLANGAIKRTESILHIIQNYIKIL